MTESAQTFQELLIMAVDQQILALEHNKEIGTLIDKASRDQWFEKLKDVVEDTDRVKIFDRTSLKNFQLFFDQADDYYQQVSKSDHPSTMLYKSPVLWFQQSYKFMFDTVSFLELIRFFAGGKTQFEKEITFRALVSKLIKTQDTIRTIFHKNDFLERYFAKNADLNSKYPAILATRLNLPQALSPRDTLQRTLHDLVSDISHKCINLFKELSVPIAENAKPALERKEYYEALILTIRHKEGEIFEELGSDDYTVLVEELAKIISLSHLHTDIYIFQHAKRGYLTDWLTNTLRDYDRGGSATFYQAGKVEIYQNYEAIQIDRKHLNDLKDRANLDNPETKEAELFGIEHLTEDEFYELLLRIYTHYKNDSVIGKSMPLSAQSLASSGNSTWEQKNMIAQVQKKMEAAAANADKQELGGAAAKSRRFGSMLSSLKKVAISLAQSFKKVEHVKKEKAPAPEKPKPAAEKAAPASPVASKDVLKVSHSGNALEICFPLPKKDVLNPQKNQRQDISWSNNDADASQTPTEQEFLVNFFNTKNEPNQPLNKKYLKFANSVMAILRSYSDHVRHIQKKIASASGNVDSFNEDILYLKIKDDVILVMGATNMGQNKQLGKIPSGKTSYVRLFLKGDIAKSLAKTGVPSAIKEFHVEDKNMAFKEVMMPSHYQAVPVFEAVLLDALFTVVESLPKDQFELLNDDSLVGFVGLLQDKAAALMDKGLQFKRAITPEG